MLLDQKGSICTFDSFKDQDQGVISKRKFKSRVQTVLWITHNIWLKHITWHESSMNHPIRLFYFRVAIFDHSLSMCILRSPYFDPNSYLLRPSEGKVQSLFFLFVSTSPLSSNATPSVTLCHRPKSPACYRYAGLVRRWGFCTPHTTKFIF